MKKKHVSFGLALFMALGGAHTHAAGAPEVGSAEQGLVLSKQWCASCHVVAADQTATVQTMAPPFASLSQIDEDREAQLRTWLTAPHGAMSALQLSRQDIADVLAYLKSLAN